MNTPVHFASTLHAGGEVGYGRDGNITWAAFEEALGALEGGSATVFASGMAATSAVLETLPLGAPVAYVSDGYTGTREFLSGAPRGRWDLRPVNIVDTEGVLAACAGAALLWVESPTNPQMDIADLPALIEGTRRRGVTLVVDNTFATPLAQRPLELGADIVVHSVTKFLSGHSDLVMGATVTRDTQHCAELVERRRLHGAIPGPMEVFLALRGLRTLAVRMERAQSSTLTLANRLAEHPAVRRVRYPGLPNHPGHVRARRQMTGFGAVVAFEVHGGAAAAEATARSTELIVHTTSLGGIETTMERRARYAAETATPPALLRMSVGCEAVEDLWADLEHALRIGQLSVGSA